MANGKFPRILLNVLVKTVDDHECEVLISQYARRLSDAGAAPMLAPAIEKPEIIETLLDAADGVLLIGGPDYDPRDYGEKPHPETSMTRLRPHFDIAFAGAALRRKKLYFIFNPKITVRRILNNA